MCDERRSIHKEKEAREMTYAQLLKETCAELERLGVPNFEQEAWWILASSAGRENSRLAAELALPVPVLVEKNVANIVHQRQSGQPLVYITGDTDFYGLRFKVSPAVLIPRPETETLVAEILKQLSRATDRHNPFLILDVGTGSGCIVLTLLAQLPAATAVATDISKEALRVAVENARGLGLAPRVRFVAGDVLEPIRSEERFDVLVSNPPYIDPSEFDSLDLSVREFEPRSAIESPKGGIWFHRQIAQQGGRLLRPGGILAFEAGNRQAGMVAQFIKKTGFYERPQIFSDLFGYQRVVLARKI